MENRKLSKLELEDILDSLVDTEIECNDNDGGFSKVDYFTDKNYLFQQDGIFDIGIDIDIHVAYFIESDEKIFYINEIKGLYVDGEECELNQGYRSKIEKCLLKILY